MKGGGLPEPARGPLVGRMRGRAFQMAKHFSMFDGTEVW